MTAQNLKSKLNRLGTSYSEQNNTIYFSLNKKKYEASISVSGVIVSYMTSNFSKFSGRDFDTFNQVLKHSQRI